jgi:hypothetical protein
MAEDPEYKVRPVDKEPEVVEAMVDEEIAKETPAVKPEPTSKKGFSPPSIPTDKIFKMVTDRKMMEQLWRDETWEPHLHLIKLLALVFILAIIISLLGL